VTGRADGTGGTDGTGRADGTGGTDGVCEPSGVSEGGGEEAPRTGSGESAEDGQGGAPEGRPDVDHVESPAETSEPPEPLESAEPGEPGEPGEPHSGGAWDDGLIARRVRVNRLTIARQDPPRHPQSETPQPGQRPQPQGAEANASSYRSHSHTGRQEDTVHQDTPPLSPLPAPAPAAPEPHPAAQRAEPARPLPGRTPVRRSPALAYAYKGFGGDPELDKRLAALRKLISLSRPRLTCEPLGEAGQVLDAAAARGRLPRAYTAIALAGATGSGKSSLFNALSGARLADSGPRRPTTAQPLACTWEASREGDADGLLDRLGIPPSARRFVRADPAGSRHPLEGLVLIDLPDHDSVAEGHREQVNELLRLVDAVVWVLDPEKYADAVLHERYLRPLAGYAEVTFVVLNQTDRLPGEAKDAVLDDLRRLLDEDGVALGEHGEPGARVLATSSLAGDGVGELRRQLADFAASRRAAALRLSADLDRAVKRLRPVCAELGPGAEAACLAGLTDEVREEFADRLASAVGAVAAGQAAERAWLRHAERTCGTLWGQLRRRYGDWRAREEGRRVAVDAGAGGTGAPHVSGATGHDVGPRVARAVVAQAVRTLADQASAGLPEVWRSGVREAAWRGAEGLPEALERAVGVRAGAAEEGATVKAEPGAAAVAGAAERGAAGGGAAVGAGAVVTAGSGRGRGRGRGASGAESQWGAVETWRLARPAWWTAALGGQAMLLALQLLGVVWALARAFGFATGSPWSPVALLAGGVVGGSLLAWGCRAAARGPARAHGQREEWRLRRLAVGCGRSRVLEPVAAELLRYREVREQYVIAAGDARSPM
jgi:energy-coupling factor transporter ATP-binding protein EcfA2